MIDDVDFQPYLGPREGTPDVCYTQVKKKFISNVYFAEYYGATSCSCARIAEASKQIIFIFIFV